LTSSSDETLSQQHQALRSLFNDESVLAVYPSQHVSSPTLAATAVENYAAGVNSTISKIISPHRLTQVDRVHKELKYTGKGILIGVIDSGVDYNHPALGGGFGEGFKVMIIKHKCYCYFYEN
jgi:subtilisin family serine protease